MRFMVDTHTLIWAMDDASRLSILATDALQDLSNELNISAATVWELSIKVGQRKLSLSLPYRQWMERTIADLDLIILPVTVIYADQQANLPPHHKDPFDRLIVAQALVEGIPIVSVDPQLDAYGITRIW